MARERLCKVCRGWHAPDDWPAECYRPRVVARGNYPLPMLIGDSMDPTQSMADGNYYTSKRAMRAHYREAGVTEVGNEWNDKIPGPKPAAPSNKAAIAEAFKRAGIWDELPA